MIERKFTIISNASATPSVTNKNPLKSLQKQETRNLGTGSRNNEFTNTLTLEAISRKGVCFSHILYY